MAPAFVWTRVDGSPALWVIFVRRRTGSDDFRFAPGGYGAVGGHKVVPAGAAVLSSCACAFFGGEFWMKMKGAPEALCTVPAEWSRAQAGETGAGVPSETFTSFPPGLTR